LEVPKSKDNGKMEFPKELFLTPYDYLTWKDKMIMHLQRRGLYKLTMTMEMKRTLAIKKIKVSKSNG
jgi:hypothetical protein